MVFCNIKHLFLIVTECFNVFIIHVFSCIYKLVLFRFNLYKIVMYLEPVFVPSS